MTSVLLPDGGAQQASTLTVFAGGRVRMWVDGKPTITWSRDGAALDAGLVVRGAVEIPMAAASHQGRYIGRGDDDSVISIIDLRVHDGGGKPAKGKAVAIFVIASALLSVVVGLSLWRHPREGVGLTVASYASACAVIAFAMALISAIVKYHRADRGFFSLFVGADRRASTSKTQLLIWTIFIAFALAYIGARTALADASFTCAQAGSANCVLEATWETYLLLLGLPAAAAVLAKGITTAKINDGELQKTTETGEAPSTTQLATDDNGNADLADVQYLLFNIIALLYVAARFFDRGVLPEVPSVLLALTGAAAGTYTLNKGLQGNKPVVTAVLPGVLAPGVHGSVYGQNFYPPGVSDQRVTVKVGGHQVPGAPLEAGGGVAFRTPPGLFATQSSLSVVTGAGVESAPFAVTIVARPAVVGWVTAAGAPGQAAGLAVAGLSQVAAVDVAFGSLVVRGAVSSSGDRVDVLVPSTLPPGSDVEVAVAADGVWSDVKQLTLG